MQFTPARPDIVRAISQRWLLKFWQQYLGAHKVPQWQDVEAESLSAISDSLSFLDVSTGGASRRFMMRFNGALITQAFGLADGRGKYLDDIMPPAHRTEGLAPYGQAVDGGCPVYTIQDLVDRDGRVVHFEHLLLPFAANGRTVDRILASFEFICPDGAFDGRDLMRVQQAPPALRLAATIETTA